MLLRTHTEDLRRITHTRFYEAFRKNKLKEMGFNDNPPDQPPVSWRESVAQKRQQRLADMSSREAEMRTAMVAKVKAKEAELKAKETKINLHYEKLLEIYNKDLSKFEEEEKVWLTRLKYFCPIHLIHLQAFHAERVAAEEAAKAPPPPPEVAKRGESKKKVATKDAGTKL